MEVSNEDLLKALNENTAINKQLLELLKVNNKHTKDIHDYVDVELSPSQQWKNFGYNIAANLVANTIESPTVINLNK